MQVHTHHLGHELERLAAAEEGDVVYEEIRCVDRAALYQDLDDRHEGGRGCPQDGPRPAVDLPDAEGEECYMFAST